MSQGEEVAQVDGEKQVLILSSVWKTFDMTSNGLLVLGGDRTGNGSQSERLAGSAVAQVDGMRSVGKGSSNGMRKPSS